MFGFVVDEFSKLRRTILNLDAQARLFKKPDTQQSKMLNHELVLDYYERFSFLNSYPL